MGTRADFYAGRGEQAEWLGSVAWDGYSMPDGLTSSKTEADFREQVKRELAGRDDATTPDMGWPWPWEDSGTTDYAYAFDGDQVWASRFGSAWWDAAGAEPEDTDELEGPKASFPRMEGMSAPPGSKRSGVMVVSAPAKRADPESS